MDIKYCIACGAPTELKIPEDDDHNRAVCKKCGEIHYQNPKMVVGCIPEIDGQILLCKRNIEPQKGLWTLPAGYLECNESVAEGAKRETKEETRADVEIIAPYRLCNIVFVSQIYFIYRAKLLTKNFGPTSESTEVRLFKEKDIPWNDIAFIVIKKTLQHYFEDRKKGTYSFETFDLR